MKKLTTFLLLSIWAAGCGGSTNSTIDGAIDAVKADIRPADTAPAIDTAVADVAADHAPAADHPAVDAAVDLGGGMTMSDGATDAPKPSGDGTTPDAAVDAPPLPDAAVDAPPPPPDMAPDAPPPPDMAPDAPPPPPDMAPDAPPSPPDMAIVMVTPDAATNIDVGTGGEMFAANLRGGEVVPQVLTTAAGTLTLSLDPNETAVAYHLHQTVTGATSAALHLASAGENGDVIIAIAPLAADVDGTAAVTALQVAELKLGRFYASVSSTNFPDGEIRGQLLRPGEREFWSNMSGEQETPPNNTGARGHATFIIDAAVSKVTWRQAVTGLTFNLSDQNFSNVHFGPPGVLSHTVVFGLNPIGPEMRGAEPIDTAGLANLARGLWSTDVHSDTYHDGEVRGQLIELAETVYTAPMSGEEVVPPVPTTPGAGGMGIILNAAHTSIRFDAMVDDMTPAPTAAFVKLGAVGANGTVVFPLTINGMMMSGDRAISPTELADLEAGNWYVEVQTAAHPGGELRGQFGRR